MAEMERADGPTPNGGAYSEIYYLDDAHNSVDASVATRCVILEYDEHGNRVFETWGVTRNAGRL